MINTRSLPDRKKPFDFSSRVLDIVCIGDGDYLGVAAFFVGGSNKKLMTTGIRSTYGRWDCVGKLDP